MGAGEGQWDSPHAGKCPQTRVKNDEFVFPIGVLRGPD